MNRPILHLPAKREPKQLTAAHRITTLGEHKEAFLNAHNRQGFAPDELPEDPNSLGAVLRAAMEMPFITKQRAKEIVHAGKMSTSKKVKQTSMYMILARLFGYPQWAQAIQNADEQGRLPNLNYGKQNLNLALFSVEGYEEFFPPPVQGIKKLAGKTNSPRKIKKIMQLLKQESTPLAVCEEIEALALQMEQTLARHVPLDTEEGSGGTVFYFRYFKEDWTKARLYAREFLQRPGVPPKEYCHINLHIDPNSLKVIGVEEKVYCEPYSPKSPFAREKE